MTLYAFLAILAGLAQAVGYLAYLFLVKKGKIDPEPTTWLMFGYGTVILTYLEWKADADWYLLIQPVVCALLGIVTAIVAWRGKKLAWPTDWGDRISLAIDLALTAAYIISKVLSDHSHASEQQLLGLVFVFLFCSNMSGIVGFFPILHNTYNHPREERPVPWFIWGFSYAILGVATGITVGFWSILMLYPLLNTVLHTAVGILSLFGKRAEQSA